MNVNVRCAKIADIPILTHLHLRLLEFEGIKTSNEKNIQWAFKKIIKSKNTFIMLIEYNENIAGMCTLHTLISSVEGGILALIEDVYIAEKYRKMGLGLKLMKEVENFCKNKKYKRIQLLCRTDNINAINFYEKLGFTKKDMFYFYKKI
jgi:ribosomal protein S18 acetylase RimI-like enzyme